MVEKEKPAIRIAIQGGPGSFNQEAARWYCMGHRIPEYEIEFGYTTEGVFKLLKSEQVTHGVFALQNSIGGVVRESIQAMGKNTFEVIDFFDIVVDHCLLVRPGTKLEEISTIMSHPQALAQCKDTLKYSYPEVALVSGEGDMIDQATAAKALAAGNLPKSTGVLASKVCADLYGLDILTRGVQDRPDNFTTFLFVKK